MTHPLRTVILLFVLFFGTFSPALAQSASVVGSYETTLLPGEEWWGGLSHDAAKMPYTKQIKLTRDLWGNNNENQSQPLLISSRVAIGNHRFGVNEPFLVPINLHAHAHQIPRNTNWRPH